MRLNGQFFYTIREDVKDEETVSGNLLVRSGMVRKVSNGIYMYMPLGLRALKKIENIIREEMNKAGALELLMPNLLPEEAYIASGRRENFGHNMFSLKDRANRSLVLGPTHEEFFVDAAKMYVKSYKDLHFTIYQIGNKYRDEPRPRYGLIRVREFFMKDSYSFDIDNEGLDKSYKKMYQAYRNIFDRMKLDYRIVKADTGVMGGSLSEEFQAITDVGEDILVMCDCGYASNLEVSECVINEEKSQKLKTKEIKYTPTCKTIEQVAKYLKEKPNAFVKTLIYKVDGKFYACLLPGDRDINEVKLLKLLNGKEIVMADPEDVEKITNSEVGFAGPIGLDIPIVVDQDIVHKYNYITGANKTDHHYINVNNNDFKHDYVGDIKNVIEGDPCPKCNKAVYFKRGIEVGNTFKLGIKYSKALELNYLDDENKLLPAYMGSYGIGLGRIMAAAAEQFNDEEGLVWPVSIAPFKVAIVLIDREDEKQKSLANALYNELNRLNLDTILDDRNERAGVKFNDMDLIGIPYRITVGNKITNGLVELKFRKTGEVVDVHINDVIAKLKDKLN